MLAFGSKTDHDGPATPDVAVAARAALEIIPLAALAHTSSLEVVAANDRCAALLQLPAEQLPGRQMRDFVPLGDLGINPTGSLRQLVRADGSAATCWMHVGAATIAGNQLFVTCIDLISPVLTDADRWRERADHDELTGLLRRGPLLEHLRQWLASEDQVVFAFLDVDGLKLINDTYGHAAGDHVLSVIARRLQEYVPSGCLVSRLSGDEFVLAGPIGTGESRVSATIAALDHTAARCGSEPIAWADHLLTVSVSPGVVVSRPLEKSGPLMARADAAMYAEKSRRRISSPVPHPGRSPRIGTAG